MPLIARPSFGSARIQSDRRGTKGMATGSRPNGTLVSGPWSRLCSVVGALVVVALATRAQVQIQPLPLPPIGLPMDPGGAPVVDLPRDPDSKRKLEAALDYIKSRDWPQATGILQSLIDIREDVFVRVTPELARQMADIFPGMKPGSMDMSVRALANALVARLPKEALELYQTAQEPKARGLLKEARENGNLDLLAKIMRSFLHTPAGREAAISLGTYYLDRGNDLAASLCFDKLIQADPDDNLGINSPTLLKAAMAMRRSGDLAGERVAWQRLSRRGTQKITLGNGEGRTPDEWKAAVAKTSPPRETGVQDWTVVGGNARRSAQSMGGTPFLEPRWPAESTLLERRFVPVQHRETITLPGDLVNNSRQFFEEGETYLVKERHHAPIPAGQPLAVTIGEENARTPILVYRSHGGILARNLKTGAVLWANPIEWTIDRMGLGGLLSKGSQKTTIQNWLSQYVTSRTQPEILFSNSVVGTLSSDAQRVFTVVDFEVPPPSNLSGGRAGPFGTTSGNFGPDINEALLHNRTEAYSLATGKLLWVAGGRGAAVGELADSHFLGVPLPIGDRLYQLNEKQQELRLAVLDPATGTLLGLQRLCTTRTLIPADSGRRVQAAHLAYADGILVCPTNSGVVLGIELLGNSFVWAHPYSPALENSEGNQQANQPFMPPGMVLPNGRFIRPGRVTAGGPAMAPIQTRWLVTPPVITGGKVVFAAPDADAIHCVSLRDGSRLWSHKRQDDDLYLGGVISGRAVVIGRKSVRALDVDGGGKVAWTLATGVPSGLGTASDNHYYLPLRESGAGKDPEICVMDVLKGEIVSHTKSRKKALPGNLVFHDGEMISQTSTAIAVYPQLSSKLAQIDELIRNNPADPVGLTERGDLRLDKGDWAGAVADLATALRNKPPPEVIERTREKLFDAMCEFARRDFPRAEAYLSEFKSVCDISPGPDPTPAQVEEARRESRRRLSAYLCLLGSGRETQGKLMEAFDTYLEVAGILGGGELQAVLDEPALKAASDTWAQGRVAAMVAKAGPPHRELLEARVAARLAKARSPTTPTDELRGLATVFGHMSSSGQEIRLLLAERLAAEGGADALAMAEQQLEMVRPPLATPEQHARALVRLAELNISRQLPDDAVACLARLAAEHPDVLVGGKTGKTRLAEAATDHRLLPFLDGPGFTFPQGRLAVSDKPMANQRMTQSHAISPEGNVLPFFSRHLVQFMHNQQTQGFNTLSVIDRATGEERMTETLARRNMLSTALNYTSYSRAQQTQPRFTFQAVGHIMLASAGNVVYAVDPLRRRVLWDMNLTNPGETASAQSPLQGSLAMDGNALWVVHNDGYRQRTGQAGPLLPNAAILVTREGMMGVDPLTGRTLWVRQDISADCQVITDGLVISIISTDPVSGKPAGVRGFRAVDGASVGVPDCSIPLANKIRLDGSNILWTEETASGKKLRLTEAVAMRDIWVRDLPPETIMVSTSGESFTAIIGPDGTLRVVDLASGKETLVARLDPRHTKDSAPFAVSDAARVYIGLHKQPEAAAQVQSAFIPASGINTRTLNGELYAIEKATGKMAWRANCHLQSLVLENLPMLPVIVMASRSNKPIPNNPAARILQTTIRTYDKRTGKLLFEKDASNQQVLQSMRIDTRKGTLELVTSQNTITHQVVEEPGAAAPPIRDQALPGGGTRP